MQPRNVLDLSVRMGCVLPYDGGRLVDSRYRGELTSFSLGGVSAIRSEAYMGHGELGRLCMSSGLEAPPLLRAGQRWWIPLNKVGAGHSSLSEPGRQETGVGLRSLLVSVARP